MQKFRKILQNKILNSLTCGDGTHIENDKCVPDSMMDGVAGIFDEIKKQIDDLLK